MNKKKWGLLLLAALLIFGYFKLFYKTYSETAVPQSADCIVAIDVKRITNTVIWNFLTTPSQWKGISFSSKKDSAINWKDMVELPDYLLAFHARNQPAHIWYMLLSIKDKAAFEKGIAQYNFLKKTPDKYANIEAGIQLLVYDNKVLITTASDTLNQYTAPIIEELFTKKLFAAKENLEKAINLKSHVGLYLTPSGVLPKGATLAANFDKEKIKIDGECSPAAQYSFEECDFSYAKNALLNIGFTQPSPAVYNLLDAASKDKLSKSINLDIDSLLAPGNTAYHLNFTGIKTRIDSAVTYNFDDEFNQIEKVVVNEVQEPAFKFTVMSNAASALFNYFENNNKIEISDTGNLFLPMPLVKSYCTLQGSNQLLITSANYQKETTDKTIKAVLYLNMIISKIPANLKKYLPDVANNLLTNIEAVNISVVKKERKLLLNCVVQKKKNDLPIIGF
jgi:hypothetical protein